MASVSASIHVRNRQLVTGRRRCGSVNLGWSVREPSVVAAYIPLAFSLPARHERACSAGCPLTSGARHSKAAKGRYASLIQDVVCALSALVRPAMRRHSVAVVAECLVPMRVSRRGNGHGHYCRRMLYVHVFLAFLD